MEVKINKSALVDFPYSPAAEKYFDFSSVDQIGDFVDELKNGTPTCYMVSGYRGVGKTSFIRKVEQEINVPKVEQAADPNSLCFIYTSFAKAESSTHLIRRLIRELYLKVSTIERYKQLDKNLKDEIELLYRRTFYEVNQVNEQSVSTTAKTTFKLLLSKRIQYFLNKSVPGIGLVLWFLLTRYSWFYNYLMLAAVPILLFTWLIVNIVDVVISYEIESKNIDGLHTKTLYDDEIAGTLFLKMLKRFESNNFKLVFVLDELDKVNSNELNTLISELKPYLLSGHSSFIAVGGQQFFYKYKAEENQDDGMLSSMFSKIVHIPLSSAPILKSKFFTQIVDEESAKLLSKEDREKLEDSINYLVFASRLVPRRFVTLVRQNVIWRDGVGIFSDSKIPSNSKTCGALIEAIDQIDESKISRDHSGPFRDLIISKMYIKLNEHVFKKSASFTRDEFRKKG